VKVLARAPAGVWARSNAQPVMTGLIREHPQFDAVFGANDNQLLGAIDAMVEAGIDPKGEGDDRLARIARRPPRDRGWEARCRSRPAGR
jgi:hypothetical protein